MKRRGDQTAGVVTLTLSVQFLLLVITYFNGYLRYTESWICSGTYLNLS